MTTPQKITGWVELPDGTRQLIEMMLPPELLDIVRSDMLDSVGYTIEVDGQTAPLVFEDDHETTQPHD